MNLPRIYLIAILLLAFDVGANGQEVPKAVLVDEFEKFGCSDLRGRIDNFLQSIVGQPGVKGVVASFADGEHKLGAIIREELIKAQVKSRKFPLSRIEFQRAVYDGEPKTQFWSIPVANSHSTIKDRDDSYSLGWISTPLLILVDDEYDEGECYDIDEPQILSHILKENAGSRLNIVFYGSTANELKNRERRMLRRFTVTNGIDRKRIRTFLKTIRRDPENPKPTEYWYLPPAKR